MSRRETKGHGVRPDNREIVEKRVSPVIAVMSVMRERGA